MYYINFICIHIEFLIKHDTSKIQDNKPVVCLITTIMYKHIILICNVESRILFDVNFNYVNIDVFISFPFIELPLQFNIIGGLNYFPCMV